MMFVLHTLDAQTLSARSNGIFVKETNIAIMATESLWKLISSEGKKPKDTNNALSVLKWIPKPKNRVQKNPHNKSKKKRRNKPVNPNLLQRRMFVL